MDVTDSGDGPGDRARDPDPVDPALTPTQGELLRERLVAELVGDLDRPHVLLITEHGVLHASGPYADAQATLCALEDDRAVNADVSEDDRFYQVVPLFPGLCPHVWPPRAGGPPSGCHGAAS